MKGKIVKFFYSCGRYIHDKSPSISEMNKQKEKIEMGIKNEKNKLM